MGLCVLSLCIDNMDGFVTAEQHVHSKKASSAPPTALTSKGAVGAQEVGRGDGWDR